MTTPQVLASAQQDLVKIMEDMRTAFNGWMHGRIDADDFGEKLTDIIEDLDDYRQAYAPTDHERALQDRDHSDELSRDVFLDAQEDRL